MSTTETIRLYQVTVGSLHYAPGGTTYLPEQDVTIRDSRRLGRGEFLPEDCPQHLIDQYLEQRLVVPIDVDVTL